jgi:pimeloyl-ACP methyl ester carboxylesterase
MALPEQRNDMAILDGPDVRTVTTTSGAVRVRDTGGDGRPLLLVHSLLLDPDLYAQVVPLLTAHGYRCVVPELPLGGHALPLLPGSDLTPPGWPGCSSRCWTRWGSSGCRWSASTPAAR